MSKPLTWLVTTLIGAVALLLWLLIDAIDTVCSRRDGRDE
jgi:hypothetical protein